MIDHHSFYWYNLKKKIGVCKGEKCLQKNL